MLLSHIYVCFYRAFFWVQVGIKSFFPSKIHWNRKFWRFGVFLKLEFEVKNWQTYTKQLPANLGCPFVDVQLSGGVPKGFFSFNPSVLKLRKISLTFTCTSAFRFRDSGTRLTNTSAMYFCCPEHPLITVFCLWSTLVKHVYIIISLVPRSGALRSTTYILWSQTYMECSSVATLTSSSIASWLIGRDK